MYLEFLSPCGAPCKVFFPVTPKSAMFNVVNWQHNGIELISAPSMLRTVASVLSLWLSALGVI